MENITLEQIGLTVAFLVALITGICYLMKSLKSLMKQLLKEQLDAIDSKLDVLEKKVDEVDRASAKNFIVRSIADVEKGIPMDDVGQERFWEAYQHYVKVGGNSYIKHKVEKLVSDSKI